MLVVSKKVKKHKVLTVSEIRFVKAFTEAVQKNASDFQREIDNMQNGYS